MKKLTKNSEKAAYTSSILLKMATILRSDEQNCKLADACVKVSQALSVQHKKYKETEDVNPFSDDIDELFNNFNLNKNQTQKTNKGSFGKNL